MYHVITKAPGLHAIDVPDQDDRLSNICKGLPSAVCQSSQIWSDLEKHPSQMLCQTAPLQPALTHCAA